MVCRRLAVQLRGVVRQWVRLGLNTYLGHGYVPVHGRARHPHISSNAYGKQEETKPSRRIGATGENKETRHHCDVLRRRVDGAARAKGWERFGPHFSDQCTR